MSKNYVMGMPPLTAPRTILLVEDEVLIAVDRRRSLERLGYRVVVSHTGEQAVPEAQSDDVDLILMDLDLGPRRMDGSEAARRILATRSVPIIFLSSHTEPDVIARTDASGAYGFVIKSTPTAVLDASIRMALRLTDARRPPGPAGGVADATPTPRTTPDDERFRALFDSAPSAIIIATRETGRIVEANAAAARLFETTVDALVGLHQTDLHPPGALDHARTTFAFDAVDAPDRQPPVEIPILTSRGVVRDVEIRASIISIDGVEHVLGLFVDVTRRRADEAELQNSLVDLQLAQRIAGIGHWQYDPEGDTIAWSDEVYRMYGRTREEGPLKLANYREICEPDHLAELNAAFARAVGEGIAYEIDIHLTFPDRGPKWFRAIGQPAASPGPSGYPVRGTVQDVTTAKLREIELTRLLEENRLLFREIDHRVKNSLTVVDSLLDLKERELPAAVDLQDVRNHIRAIRLVHEQLYASDALNRITMQDYLTSLSAMIFPATGPLGVGRSIEAEGATLPTRIATVIGIIVSELGTNALKHGFLPDGERLFRVALERERSEADPTDASARQTWSLSVENSGRPFPEDVDLQRSTSLGVRIVAALSQQIGGDLTLRRSPTPRFTIRFTVDP